MVARNIKNGGQRGGEEGGSEGQGGGHARGLLFRVLLQPEARATAANPSNAVAHANLPGGPVSRQLPLWSRPASALQRPWARRCRWAFASNALAAAAVCVLVCNSTCDPTSQVVTTDDGRGGATIAGRGGVCGVSRRPRSSVGVRRGRQATAGGDGNLQPKGQRSRTPGAQMSAARTGFGSSGATTVARGLWPVSHPLVQWRALAVHWRSMFQRAGALRRSPPLLSPVGTTEDDSESGDGAAARCRRQRRGGMSRPDVCIRGRGRQGMERGRVKRKKALDTTDLDAG